MTSPLSIDPRAVRLRDAFDRAFARAPSVEAGETDDFLLLRASGAPYALRVAQIAGVAARKALVPVPGRRTELLGLAGIRGAVVCVYGLSRLLGLAGGAEEAAWLALVATDDADPVGLAFDALEGFVRVPRLQVHEPPAGRADSPVGGVVQVGSGARPVIDVTQILAVIQKSAGATGPTGSPP